MHNCSIVLSSLILLLIVSVVVVENINIDDNNDMNESSTTTELSSFSNITIDEEENNANESSKCRDLDRKCWRRVHMCDVKAYVRVMKKNCRKTCDYCDDDAETTTESSTTTTTTNITDAIIITTTTSATNTTTTTELCIDIDVNCRRKKHLCNNITYRELMMKKCRKTCALCEDDETTTITTRIAPPACIDRTADCVQKKKFCEMIEYRAVMAKNCRKTCGFC
jgi:hypothetical protein